MHSDANDVFEFDLSACLSSSITLHRLARSMCLAVALGQLGACASRTDQVSTRSSSRADVYVERSYPDGPRPSSAEPVQPTHIPPSSVASAEPGAADQVARTLAQFIDAHRMEVFALAHPSCAIRKCSPSIEVVGVGNATVETIDWNGFFGRPYRTSISFRPVYAGGSLVKIEVEARESNNPVPAAFVGAETTKSLTFKILGGWLKNRLGGSRGNAADVIAQVADGNISIKGAMENILYRISAPARS